MEEDKLATLIRPLECFAEAKPGLYRFRVGLLAALGYLYLLVVVSILLGIVAVTLFYMRFNWITIKILWIPLALVGLVLRSLWISIPEPDGTELRREQAPALFELINEVTRKLSGPKIHHVMVSDDFNAYIVQIPQFGMFGWLRNYVVVGLPLLRALNPAEFRSVLAHEVGHLSGKHGRFSGWIYRLRQSWIEVLTRVHYEKHYASFLFEPFIAWYAPYLNAYSFVLARAQERQADQYSVELAGKEVAAVTLVRLMAKERGLAENFWPNFFRQSGEQPKTPRDPFVQMLSGLDQPIGPANTQKWFFEALRVPTGYEDTHPALGDRLAAIGFAKDGPEVTALMDGLLKADEQQQSAESYYLRELPEDFMATQNRLWRERIAQPWSSTHEHLKQVQKRLQELDEQGQTRALTLEEQWERVTILSEVKDRMSAIPSIQAILSENPDHTGAHFLVGAILLEQQNAEGVKHLEKAMQLSPALTSQASTLLSGFYFEQGNKELGEEFCKRAAEQIEKERKQQEQAMTFSDKDRFVPHDLDEEAVKKIQIQLSKIRGLGRAYLVRKVMNDFDILLYVFAVTAAFSWRNGQNEKHIEPLMNELANIEGLPSPIVLLSLDGVHNYLLDKIAAIDGAELHATADNEAEIKYLS
jgi:Zn-dependent protease with chaperone function